MDNKSIQKKLLIILKAIDEICKRENISYMLTQGTLLGAIREKGFIEWDIEDADIMMHRNEFNTFEAYCNKYSADCGISLYYNDEFVPRAAFSENPELFVEIILIDQLPENKLKRKIKIMMLGILRTGFFIPNHNSIGKLFVFVWLLLDRLLHQESKLVQYKKVSQMGNGEHSDSVFFSNENLKRMHVELDESLLKETVRISFEDTELIGPKEWNSVLKFYYGDDYMVPKRENYYI